MANHDHTQAPGFGPFLKNCTAGDVHCDCCSPPTYGVKDLGADGFGVYRYPASGKGWERVAVCHCKADAESVRVALEESHKAGKRTSDMIGLADPSDTGRVIGYFDSIGDAQRVGLALSVAADLKRAVLDAVREDPMIADVALRSLGA